MVHVCSGGELEAGVRGGRCVGSGGAGGGGRKGSGWRSDGMGRWRRNEVVE
jgi:hypothetical protein